MRKRAQQIEAETALRESEVRFRELADNISQFAWTANQAGWRYWYNKRWYDYTGTTLEEMQGWGWQKVHHPEHVDRVVQRIRQSFESGEPWEDTFPLRGRDGNYRWFLSRALPIRNEAGEVIRWFGTNTDVTEQIEAERALRDLNESLRDRVEAETRERLHLWNVSEDLLVVADQEGKYISVNPAWTAALGWTEADLLGKSSQWLLHPEDREKTRAEIDHLVAGRKTVRFENRFRRKDGSYRWISWKAAPDRGRIYATGRDITELKNAESALWATQRELGQVARRSTLAAMTAAIAQEIKQRLNSIVANAGAARRWLKKSPPELNETSASLEIIIAEGHRASDVIESVRELFSKNDQSRTLIDVNELVRETIAIVHDELDDAGVLVEYELNGQLPLLLAHKTQIQQVMMNIFTNATDAMRAVTDRSRVLRVRSERCGPNSVTITVEDSGTGIEASDINKIFDAFFTTKKNGMGMGLAICRSIVDAHGGSLSASRGAPHGSIFAVVLPGSQ
jgi:PAS domain S-box-containing protein